MAIQWPHQRSALSCSVAWKETLHRKTRYLYKKKEKEKKKKKRISHSWDIPSIVTMSRAPFKRPKIIAMLLQKTHNPHVHHILPPFLDRAIGEST